MTTADQDFGTHRQRGGGRRGSHAKTSPRWPDGGVGPYATQRTLAPEPPLAGGDPRFGRQDPRWPDAGPSAYGDAEPPAYQADHYQTEYYQPESRQWSGQPEHPGWTGQPAYQDQYAGWTEPPAPQAGYPEWTGPPAPQAGYPEWTGPPASQAGYPEWTGPPAYQEQYPDPGWARPPAPQAEYPGWMQQPGWNEQPGWTEQPPPPADYPVWPGQHQVEYPGQAGQYGQYALHPDHPSWPESQIAPWPGDAPVIDRRSSGAADAPPLPERVRPPYTPQPDFPPRADTPPHPAGLRRDLPLHRDMDFYSAPIMTDTITDVANWAQPDAAYAQPAREQVWDASSSQLADWIIEDANQQAAEITREARNQASSSLADAHKEAAELVRRTGEQAALTIEAAELQAAEIRATMMKLTTELTGMAAYVTQNLTPAPAAPSAFAPPASAPPTAKPATQPVTGPAAEPAAEPGAAPSARPAAAPRTRPGATTGARPGATTAARPAVKANAKSRQHAAVRVMSVFTAAMVLFALTAGGTEVALHGFKFFVFRSAGTGETSGSGLQENQGPGQPDAPGAHQQLQKP
jgi:hypothetical protein